MVEPSLQAPLAVSRKPAISCDVEDGPRKQMSNLIEAFMEFYNSKGYLKQEPVKITSRIDPTIHFIGSHISVYKKYLTSRKIPGQGYCMAQKCVRNQNLNNYFKTNHTFKYSSYFYSLGVIAPPTRLDNVCSEFFEFLKTKLEINPKDIKLRISSTDESLVQACIKSGMQSCIELDTKPKIYYIHKLGMTDYIGHSFNFAIWDKQLKDFSDVGNIILINYKNETIAVEVAFGAGIMLKTHLGLDHVIDCFEVQGLENQETSLRRKFEDAIITTLALYDDGLRPKNSPTKNRILGTYVKSLSYFRKKANISVDELEHILQEFTQQEFPNTNNNLPKEIICYLKDFEKKTSLSLEFYKKIEQIS